ncbi:hypothetical protein V3C99_009240 [Haemonchus contortus]
MQPIIIHFVLFAIGFCLSTATDIRYGSPKAVGPCILNRCPRGFQCDDSECVPDMDQIEELGPCVNNLCPKSYQCNDNTCIRPIPRAREGAEPIGPCVNDKCPDSHICVADDYKCYPIE